MGPDIAFQLIQASGSIMILVAFIGVQTGRLQPARRSYLVLNLIGSTVLTATGVIAGQWGFVLLEGVWALVSLGALLGLTSRPSTAL